MGMLPETTVKIAVWAVFILVLMKPFMSEILLLIFHGTAGILEKVLDFEKRIFKKMEK